MRICVWNCTHGQYPTPKENRYTYTSFAALSSTQRPAASACHFNIVSATTMCNCPSSSEMGSSIAFSLFFSTAALRPPYLRIAAAACADVVDVPEVDVVAAAELS